MYLLHTYMHTLFTPEVNYNCICTLKKVWGEKMLLEKEIERLSLYEKSLKSKSLSSNWPFQASQKI